MARNIVLLTDGTGDAPRLRGDSNVLRLHDLLVKDAGQLVWYHPGVGTQGAPTALTPLGRLATRVAGLGFGYGLKQDVAEAYRFLMRVHEPGDRIMLFGFSRGAYTARAIAGLLYQVGLLRPELEPLVPYALRLFWWDEDSRVTPATWQAVSQFSDQFARDGFPRRWDGCVHHVGVWDTVNATGVLRGRLVLPWTRAMPMAASMSHAVSIDERRRPFRESRIAPDQLRARPTALREVWFAGVHADVGGTLEPDHRLADITLGWVAGEAVARGLRVDEERLAPYLTLPDSAADGEIHPTSPGWRPTTIGFHRTIEPADALVHESVELKVRRSADGPRPYRPRLPVGVRWEPWPRRREPPTAPAA